MISYSPEIKIPATAVAPENVTKLPETVPCPGSGHLNNIGSKRGRKGSRNNRGRAADWRNVIIHPAILNVIQLVGPNS